MAMRGLKILDLLAGDPQADRIVPPTGFTVRITFLTSAAMAFLAVFAIALSISTDRLANRWASELARTSTLRIAAPADQIPAQTRAALTVLETTPGVGSARALSEQEQVALLSPWFGPDLPIETLPIPQLIEIVETGDGYDPTGLRARLQAEVPGAILDDHTRWRAPLVKAADRLRSLGWVTLILIAGIMAGLITLAANAALSANDQVIKVMRLVGAKDRYIARAFVRRFTLRCFYGAVVGAVLGALALVLLPGSDTLDGFLTGLGISGAQWAWLLTIPLTAAVVAFISTRQAALRTLRGKS